MANYNLGSVQGEIRITYNGRGVAEAEADLARLGAGAGGAGDDVDEFGSRTEAAGSKAENFGKKTEKVFDGVGKIGSAMAMVSKIGFLGGAAQELVGFAQALAPLSGLLAVLPAAGLSVAAVFATVKIATAGMGDAFKAVASGDAKALDEAMKKLAPSAQNFVRSYASIKPALDSVKMNVQGAFFANLGSEMQRVSTAYIPTLDKGLTGIAGSLNRMALQSAEALMSPGTVQALNTVLGDTSTTMDNLGGSLGEVLAGVINMAGAGSSWIPLWTNGASDIASGFREWTASAAGQAQVNTWIQQGANALGEVWKILQNLGGIIGNVFGAMQTGSGGMLENIVALTQKMEDWTSSAEGQQTLVGIFTLLHNVFEGVLGVIGVILPIVQNLAAAYNSLTPEVQGVVGSVIAWSGALGTVIGYAAPVVGFLTEHGAMLMNIARISGNVVMAIGRVALAILRTAATLAVQAIRMAASWLIAMGPIGWIIIAIIALVALIIIYWDQIKAATIAIWTATIAWLTGIWNSIVSWATGIWNGIVAFLSGIWASVVATWNTVWNSVMAFLQPIWDVIVSIITVAWDVIKNIFVFVAAIILALFFTIWNPLSELVMTIWNAIVAFLTMIWTGIVAQATALWNLLVTAITTVNQMIMDFITPIWNAIVAFLTMIWNGIVTAATTVWNILSTAVTAANQAIMDFIMPIWNAIVGFLTGVWNAISSVVSTAVNAVWSVISSVFNTISGFITSIWNTVFGFISGVWTRIVSAIGNGLNQAWSAISSWGSKVMGIAGQAINWLVDAGRNIVTGLWNGIVGMGTWLYDKIMGWVRSVVPGPILSFLGIASPSKYMRDEVGHQIPAGVAVGIDKNAAVAEAAASDMAKGIGAAATTATTQQMTIAQRVLPATGLGGLSGEVQSRIGALALSVGAAGASASPAAAAASLAGVTGATTSSSSTRSLTIGSVTIPVTGNLDPTKPVEWRLALEEIKDGLLGLEKSYA